MPVNIGFLPAELGAQSDPTEKRETGRKSHWRKTGLEPCEGFSPHAWGWTLLLDGEHRMAGVFPTRVGVDL